MSSRNTTNRNDDRKEDPPLSRIFIVCSKDMQKDDLRAAFEKFGEIHDIYMPKDRNTGGSKGVAYIKYMKTSSAAAAIQEMHLKTIGDSNKPVKVMVAVEKNDSKGIPEDYPHNRLFIVISKQSTESDVKDYFSQFGHVQSIHILKDKMSKESKGLAYIQFDTFLEAAQAVEQCDKKYKAIFAAPKQDLKRSRDNSDHYNDMSYNSSSASMHRDFDNYHDYMMPRNNMPMPMPRDNSMLPLIKAKPQNFNTVHVTCSPAVHQMYIERLFNIIPGITNFQFSMENYNNISKALITYNDQRAAAHAVESLNNFEFPSGEIIYVKPDNPLSKAAEDLSSIVSSFKTAVDAGSPDLTQLADAIAKASSLIKAATGSSNDIKPDIPDQNYCSVPLPPLQPLASPDSSQAQRCFIVCNPRPPAQSVLRDVFRRFGDLIDVNTFPNKTYGFARYASVGAAQRAMKTLHGATVCGARLKVLEADEKTPRDSEHKNDSDVDRDNYMDTDNDNMNVKRKKQYDPIERE